MSKYVRQQGCKTLQNGEIVMNYHCCRSGTYKPKGKGLKNLKSQGSAKIGISCPAVIKVRQSTENVVVHYFPKHPNHETQLEHLRLSESDRTAIAGRLKEGVSKKEIFQDIREEITVDSGRKMLIEKKDIHNIKRDFNINGYVKRHEIDAQNYAQRLEKWAYCYRKGLGINTNMYLESLHEKIKYHYFDGKHVRRLDVAIDGLLKLVRDS
ncbi:MULE domain-containing protein [Trichonephila clavipes]|uniref:MULE domain-containing protein n=1 Tax=Trichonephila clavipes TaxID=2585209 RepID=A0A8X6UZJ8_TRICX|nr:MULE domain-containing protein [Trichonephila clavipes]